MTKKELLMLIMPSLSGMTGYGILQFYQNITSVIQGKVWYLLMGSMDISFFYII